MRAGPLLLLLLLLVLPNPALPVALSALCRPLKREQLAPTDVLLPRRLHLALAERANLARAREPSSRFWIHSNLEPRALYLFTGPLRSARLAGWRAGRPAGRLGLPQTAPVAPSVRPSDLLRENINYKSRAG